MQGRRVCVRTYVIPSTPASFASHMLHNGAVRAACRGLVVFERLHYPRVASWEDLNLPLKGNICLYLDFVYRR